MIDITKTFERESKRFDGLKEIFRDNLRRQLNQTPVWQVDILEEEIKRLREVK